VNLWRSAVFFSFNDGGIIMSAFVSVLLGQ
jgi:hypothetical protein